MNQGAYYLNLQNSLKNSNTPSPISNVDFTHNNNSRSNSNKRVAKPSSAVNTTLNMSKFDALSRENRSNTYHFGNNNVNNSRGADFNNYLNIYDDEEEDEDVNNILGNNENTFNQQFMDSQQIKFANFNNDKSNYQMNLDSIQDNRANTISKQHNAAQSSFDNVLMIDKNNKATNYMDFMSADSIAINSGFDVPDSSKDYMKYTAYNNNIKVEESTDSFLLNGTSTNMNKSNTDSSSGSANNKGSSDSKKKKPKVSHNVIERKYRENINDKIDQFKHIVPTLQICCLREDYLKEHDSEDVDVAGVDYLDSLSPDPSLLKRLDGLEPAKKLSKAIILSKSYEYVEHLERKVELLESKLMRYEQIMKSENNSARPSITEGNFMQTSLSNTNQMNYMNMSKSNSSGSYYMPDYPIFNNQIPKPPQDIKGPSQVMYQNNIISESQQNQLTLNKQISNVNSHALSNSGSSMQSSNQFENYDNLMAFNMKNGVNENSSVVGFKVRQSPMMNVLNSSDIRNDQEE